MPAWARIQQERERRATESPSRKCTHTLEAWDHDTEAYQWYSRSQKIVPITEQ